MKKKEKGKKNRIWPWKGKEWVENSDKNKININKIEIDRVKQTDKILYQIYEKEINKTLDSIEFEKLFENIKEENNASHKNYEIKGKKTEKEEIINKQINPYITNQNLNNRLNPFIHQINEEKDKYWKRIIIFYRKFT